MAEHDVIVVGAGISGLTFAFESARAGRKTLVLEREDRVGGCLATHRAASGYWYELGAHTCYNSYVGLAGILETCGLREDVFRRAPTKLRFVDGDRLVPGANMGVLLRLFRWGELLRCGPRMFTEKKDGHTVYSYYSRIVGRRNYGEVLGPMLSAVPSQSADAFPADMLFKARKTRRKDFPRSFTVRNGLQAVAERIAGQPRIVVRTGAVAEAVERDGDRWAVVAGGERHVAPVVAVATTPGAASALVRGAAPELSAQIARVKEATVETLGFAVRAEKVAGLPVSMFLVPRDDVFHSVVTRDSVPDPAWRGFAFHFRPGVGRGEKLARAAKLLHVELGDLEDLSEKRTILPSPVLGHADVVAEIDRLSAGGRLCVTGNWFAGLSIEDCVDRSRREWARVAGM